MSRSPVSAAFDLSEFALPPITTVDVGAASIGRKTAEMILEALEGHHDAPLRIEMPINLLSRESTGGP